MATTHHITHYDAAISAALTQAQTSPTLEVTVAPEPPVAMPKGKSPDLG